MNASELKLPITFVSKSDVNRVLRELEALSDFFISAAARKAGSSIKPPRITYLLEQLARDNQYNLLEESHRRELKSKLEQILKTAPLIHISFAAEPTPPIIDAILSWLRSNIHSQLLLQIGLQPTIAAGCVLRTPNKIFDMSLRSYLESQENYLAELIQGVASGKQR